MKEWKAALLGQHATIQTGPFGSQLHAADYVEVGIPSIMPTNIGTRLEVVHDGIARITEADAERLARYRVVAGDIVYSRRGDVERCAYITDAESGWLCGTGCLRVRIYSPVVHPRFCAYYLATDEIKGWISGHAVGSTMPNLNSSTLQRLPLVLPPLAEQVAIAELLQGLDTKIDLLRRQNQTLEGMAGALFRQWFSASLDDAESGCRIDALIDFNPTRKLAKGVAAPYVEMAALSEHSFNPEGWYERALSSGMKFVNGDTLLARITPCLENGKTAYITFLKDGEVAWGSTEYIVMRPKDGLHPLFAYAMARHGDFRDHAEGCLAGSSGRQRVELEHLKGYRVRAPSPEGIAAFNRTAAAIEPKLNANSKQINTLQALRDNLLPKLMSGEVRVAG